MANYNISELKLKRIPSDFKKVKVACSKDSADFSRQFFQDDLTIYESMFLILVNNSNVTTSYVKISQGGVVGTVVDVVLIAKYFVDSLARGIILVHNHPSGNKKPSEQDRAITRKVRQAIELFDGKIIDHIILTENDYTSFADEGLL